MPLDDLDATAYAVLNHDWSDPATFVSLGVISADEVATISGGRLAQDVDVRINRAVVEHDVVLIAGPVFPHEVVGFSGGNKYLFPGVAGPEIIDLSHWLGALITSYEIIGTRGTTPVRALIDRAASLVPTPRLCFAMVVHERTAQHLVRDPGGRLGRRRRDLGPHPRHATSTVPTRGCCR